MRAEAHIAPDDCEHVGVTSQDFRVNRAIRKRAARSFNEQQTGILRLYVTLESFHGTAPAIASLLAWTPHIPRTRTKVARFHLCGFADRSDAATPCPRPPRPPLLRPRAKEQTQTAAPAAVTSAA